MASSLRAHLSGHQVHKAFANDVGIVLEDVWGQLDGIVSLLNAFGAISGMKFNIGKTVGIPLWRVRWRMRACSSVARRRDGQHFRFPTAQSTSDA